MSFSQQHCGKNVVPWFNSLEWKMVYNMIFVTPEINHQKALKMLKTWKRRTPLLSAGVEGTLIILEALLLDASVLEEQQLAQMYALALMRFLNLCAANANRQGVFTRSMEQNELPKWLADLRHDVAHSHKLPSIELLKVGIDTAFHWLHEKYWDEQYELIKNYEVQEGNFGIAAVEVLHLYARWIRNTYDGCDSDIDNETLIGKLQKLMKRKSNKRKLDSESVKHILKEALKQSLADSDNKLAVRKNMKVLVSPKYILAVAGSIEGNSIPLSFKHVWTDLLNILSENNLVTALLEELHQVTGNGLELECIRKTAALWMDEIYKGLIEARNNQESQESICERKDRIIFKASNLPAKEDVQTQEVKKDCIVFNSFPCLSTKEAHEHENKIMSTPNTYTFHYLKSMLQFVGRSEHYIEDTLKLLKKLLWVHDNTWNDSTATLEDLKIEDTIENASEETQAMGCGEVTNEWILIEETSSFKGCPLGVLPHQSRSLNPALLGVFP